MASRLLLLVASVFWAIALLSPEGATAANYTVGGEIGWDIPPDPSFYATWAAKQTYAVGDSLLFNFTTGHNVVQVSSLAANCSDSAAISDAISTGPTTVKLTKAGPHFYICRFPGHCGAGQVLAINVSAATAASPAPAPPLPSDAAPPPGASSMPTDPSLGGGPSSSSMPAAPKSGSPEATGPLALTGLVAWLVVAYAFVLA